MKGKRIIEIYDKAITSNSNYKKMNGKIASLVKGNILEIGSGTGLLTKEILKKSKKVSCVEPDKEFIRKFKQKGLRTKLVNKKFQDYKSNEKFDFIVMSLVLHHIPDRSKLSFLRKIKKNIASESKLIIGDVFIPKYKNKEEKRLSLRKFHENRIKKMKMKEAKLIEKIALEDGLKGKKEYKISVSGAKTLFVKAGYKIIEQIKIGP